MAAGIWYGATNDNQSFPPTASNHLERDRRMKKIRWNRLEWLRSWPPLLKNPGAPRHQESRRRLLLSKTRPLMLAANTGVTWRISRNRPRRRAGTKKPALEGEAGPGITHRLTTFPSKVSSPPVKAGLLASGVCRRPLPDLNRSVGVCRQRYGSIRRPVTVAGPRQSFTAFPILPSRRCLDGHLNHRSSYLYSATR